MSIIERFKSIFKKQNQLLLEEDKTKTIEDGVARYLTNLCNLSSIKSSSNLSYYALLGVNSHDSKNKGKNDKNEEKLIKKVRSKHDKYGIMTQPRSSDKPIHNYIVYNRKLDINKLDKDSTRMYINLKRENIAEFAQEFIKQVGEHDFYIKFRSDIGAQESRSDPFVIYLKNEDKEYFTNIVRQISEKNTHIMDGTNQRNPFLAKGAINSIAEVPQPESGVIILHDNRAMGVTKSYNSIVSYLLEDSFRATLQEQIGESIDVTKMGLINSLEVFDDKIENIDSFIRKMTNNVIQGLKKNNMPMKGFRTDMDNRNSLLDDLHINSSKINIVEQERAEKTEQQREEK